jgi:protein NRD1
MSRCLLTASEFNFRENRPAKPDLVDSQITANNAQPAHGQVHLDPNQLKLFQQLTQTVSGAKTPPIQTHQPPPAPTTASSEVIAGPSNPPTYWNNPRNTLDKPWGSGNDYQASPTVEENNYHGHRGRFRGGYRSRVRGQFGDRDREGYRERFYDAARSPPGGHGRTSRSRSPPRSRYGGGAGRRDIKPYSPPHRPSIADQPNLDAASSSSSQQHPGVDEFGREIRPSSDDDGRRSETPDDPKPRPAPPPIAALAHAHLSPTSNPAVLEGAPLVSDEQESSATPQTVPANAAGSSEALHQNTAGDVGLGSFDYSAFDPTSPSSWEALGKAWAATNGRQPLQEELMMFVMEFTVSSMANQTLPPGGPAAQADNQWTTSQGQRWMGDAPNRGGPPRGGRGRGGAFGNRGGRRGFYSGGSGRGGREYGGGDGYEGYGDANGTDAIVLGEHTNDTQSSQAQDAPAHEQVEQAGLGEGEEGEVDGRTGTGGRMQKVGDNWVFVRNDGSS